MNDANNNLLGNSNPAIPPSGNDSQGDQVVDPLVTTASTTQEPLAPTSETKIMGPQVDAVSSTTSTPGLIVTNASPTATKATEDYNSITDSLLGQIGEIGEASNFKMLLFSYPGRTKSSFLGTAPNNLVYDFEDGLIAARTAYVNSGRPMAPNVKSLPFTDLKQADELIERLQDNHPAFDAWNVFSVDTISTMHKRMLEYVMRREKQKMPSMNEYDPQTEHYTEVNEVLTRFVQGLCDIKTKDIIITCHAQTVEPKGKQAKTYGDFSEKLYNKLAAKMDVVAYVEMFELEVDGVKKPRPVFRVVSEGTIQCKTRIPLPPEILDPTWIDFKNEFEKAKTMGTLADA